ncbi:MAG: hypothetical protein ACTHQM_12520 [Thermoanaerobaculia bacterium]
MFDIALSATLAAKRLRVMMKKFMPWIFGLAFLFWLGTYMA